MVNPRADRSRLGDLLVEMRLVDAEALSAALAEHRSSGRRLPRVLAERRVLDEERLAKAVAAKLGLEAVNVSTLKIHDRVLQLIPAEVARKYGVLPIAIKRTNQSELLYLVMVDPLDTEAIGEVQRLTGRQVRVLMATASDVDLALANHYGRLAANASQSANVSSRPPIQATPGSVRPPPRRAPESSKVTPRPLPPPNPSAADAPMIVRGTPAPPPAVDSRPRYPAVEQRTLIDGAQDLADEPVMPQELDPPDSVSTRIDPEPFSRLLKPDAGASNGPAAGRDWDLAVSAWGDASDPMAGPVAGLPSSEKPDQVTSEASLENIPVVGIENEGDDGEDLKTSQLELSEVGAAELRRQIMAREPVSPPAPRASQAGQRTLASTLEVPIEVRDDHHPFDGPSVEEIPTGLERTGIIPAIDWEADEFVPPPLKASASSGRHVLVGTSDIPMSAEAVRARATELGEAPKSAPEEDVIEAIEEVSLEPLGGADVLRFEEPEEYPPTAEAPKKRRSDPPAVAPIKPLARPLNKATGRPTPTPPPAVAEVAKKPATPPPKVSPMPQSMAALEDSDADRIPVIEPSSLMSLMDDGGDGSVEDTGADAAPFGQWQDSMQPPATRLFDESNRQVVQAPQAPEKEDDPTNPRIDTSSVQAALAGEETQAATTDSLPPITDDMSAEPRSETEIDAPTTDELPAPEDPTPSEDTVDRESVLSALDGAFWEPAPPPPEPVVESPAPVKPTAPSQPPAHESGSEEATSLVAELVAGDSLTSADRAQLVLAIGRLLVKKGLITREALAEELDFGS